MFGYLSSSKLGRLATVGQSIKPTFPSISTMECNGCVSGNVRLLWAWSAQKWGMSRMALEPHSRRNTRNQIRGWFDSTWFWWSKPQPGGIPPRHRWMRPCSKPMRSPTTSWPAVYLRASKLPPNGRNVRRSSCASTTKVESPPLINQPAISTTPNRVSFIFRTRHSSIFIVQGLPKGRPTFYTLTL